MEIGHTKKNGVPRQFSLQAPQLLRRSRTSGWSSLRRPVFALARQRFLLDSNSNDISKSSDQKVVVGGNGKRAVAEEMDEYHQEKVRKFEEFVDQRLKPDLVRAIAERDKVFEQQKTFSDLKKNTQNLEKNSVTSLRTLVNLGSEIYLQAEVPDMQRIFVDVELGFHVEFTWSEALNFISLREEKLTRQIEEYTRLIASIKAQIKLVCEGIRELLQLPAEVSAPERFF